MHRQRTRRHYGRGSVRCSQGELKNRPLEEVNFTELLTASGISRREADAVADDLFRKVADRFARDGVITDKERSKLQVLTRTLEIDPARADRIEAAAKSARYQQAVSEALADGTVTAEEARLLNRLRMQLGIEESAWAPGDLVPRQTHGGFQVPALDAGVGRRQVLRRLRVVPEPKDPPAPTISPRPAAGSGPP